MQLINPKWNSKGSDTGIIPKIDVDSYELSNILSQAIQQDALVLVQRAPKVAFTS